MKAYYNENDKFAAAWLRELIQAGLIMDGDVDERSIVDVKPEDLEGYDRCHFFAGIGGWELALQLAGWDGPVWTGSPPCQPFSSAGKGKGTADERHLWPEFARLIRECRPATVFGEQVASKAGREWFDGVSTDLEDMGYAAAAADLCAASKGAPHIRQRLFWVADAGRVELSGNAGAVRSAQTQRDSQRKLDGREHHDAGDGGEVCSGLADAMRKPERESRRVDAALTSCWDERKDPAKCGVNDRGLADATSGHASEVRRSGQQDLQRSGQHGLQPQVPGDSGLGDTIDTRPQGHAEHGGDGPQPRRQHADQDRPTPSSSWDDFELVRCVEPTKEPGRYVEKWRRVEPKLIKMVDGISGTMVSSLPKEMNDATKNQKRPSEVLQGVSKEDETKEDKHTAGGLGGVQETGLLRPELYGKPHGRKNQSKQSQEQPEAIGKGGQRGVPGLRGAGDDTARTPQRREPDEQQRQELIDCLRLVPSSIALSQLYGDTATKEALLALQKTVISQGILLNTPQQIEASWRSATNSQRECVWRAFRESGLVRTIETPLAHGLPARVGRLRGYGNAIVPQVAAEFITAYMETQ